MKKTNKHDKTETPRHEKHVRRKLLRLFIQFLTWSGAAVLYYVIFSLFFDTPIDHEIRRNNRILEKQYGVLTERFDSLSVILDDVVARDKNVYSMLFQSEPYTDVEEDYNADIDEKLLSMSNEQLSSLFFSKLEDLNKGVSYENAQFEQLQELMISKDDELNNYPAIQPVDNRSLTALAASYGQRIHPFYKTMSSHQGVDFAVAEESGVFATADGIVSDVSNSLQGRGLAVVIDHKNGYKTIYGHLNSSLVNKDQAVKRGDIIARSGNSGLSFMPHLHYEVIHNGRRVDPINYFFYELTPEQLKKINKIGLIGMQSLD